MISGAQPTNCYGGYFSRQLGSASSRNYAIASEGPSIFMYDSNVGHGGFDIEDTSHTAHTGLYVNSDNTVLMQAIDATKGIVLATSAGAGRYVFNDSLLNITNPLTVSGLTTATGGIKAGASGSTVSDTRELVQLAHSCGTTSTCSNSTNGSYREIFGSAALTSGSPSTVTVTGVSPAFT